MRSLWNGMTPFQIVPNRGALCIVLFMTNPDLIIQELGKKLTLTLQFFNYTAIHPVIIINYYMIWVMWIKQIMVKAMMQEKKLTHPMLWCTLIGNTYREYECRQYGLTPWPCTSYRNKWNYMNKSSQKAIGTHDVTLTSQMAFCSQEQSQCFKPGNTHAREQNDWNQPTDLGSHFKAGTVLKRRTQ